MEIHKNLQDQKSEVYLKLEQNMGCELWEDGFMKLELAYPRWSRVWQKGKGQIFA